MPRPRFEQMDAVKKERLLTAAQREFGEHGYEGASINRILDDAGFSKSSFYYYFDDKADLASTIFLSVAAPMLRELTLSRPDTAEAFWLELRRMSHERLRELESNRVAYACVTRLSGALATTPMFATNVLPAMKQGAQALRSFFARGVEIGALRRDVPLDTLMSLMQSTKAALYAAQFPGDVVPTDAQMETFSDLVIDLARRLSSPAT